MKLLYITNGINGAGGLERVLSIKASYLADHLGYDITILTLNETHPNSFYNFSPKVKLTSIDVVGNPVNYLRSYSKGMREMVNNMQPDVISVCDDGLKGFFIPLILRTKIPIIYERHVSKEIEMNEEFSFMKKMSIQAKWKTMDLLGANFKKFVVLTNGNLNEWKSLRNLMVIPNPLSFYPKKSSTLTNKKVIAVGRQAYQKGYDILLEAWAKVSDQFPEWKLEIYGKKDSRCKLKELAQKLNIDTKVAFFDPEKNIEDKYLDASIYVMSSRFEGFGMVLIEAMACGVPCVSFDCNYGPSDIIQNNLDGLIVKSGDVEALSNAIIKLISDEKMRHEMGQNAKENVKRYLPENIVVQWHELFNEIVR